MANQGYEVNEDKSDDGIIYFFISKGKRDVIKAVQYSYITDINGKNVFNLGFGDYDIKHDSTDDLINTDNGDVYKVFNTVLSTVVKFFEAFEHAMIMVQGSDSEDDYIETCKLTCKKKCVGYCKNQHRRIGIYSYFVNKNFDSLNEEYAFFSGTRTADKIIELKAYTTSKKYDSIFVMKKKL